MARTYRCWLPLAAAMLLAAAQLTQAATYIGCLDPTKWAIKARKNIAK
jgi:hypothetical protein